MDKTTVTKLLRVAWRTVGTICERVVAEELDPNRLGDLFILGVDEISYRKRHNYLTLVTNHETGKIVYEPWRSGLDQFSCSRWGHFSRVFSSRDVPG
jgi:hypothetical protein